MGTLSLVSEYLKDLEECIDDGYSRVAKEAKLFDALEHKSVVIEVDNQKIAIFTKVPLWAFGEPFMRYSLPCKVDGQGAWDAELDLADSANYVTEKVLKSMGFMHVSLSDYGRKMVNDVNVEIHVVKFKADFVVLDYFNEGEPSILFRRDFLETTKSKMYFGLGEIRMNLTKFEESIDVINLSEEVGSSSEEVVKIWSCVFGKKRLKASCFNQRKSINLVSGSFEVPRVANWRLFDGYGFEDILREMMKLEYIYEGDGDIFVDYSWERALSIDNEIYPEWVLEFFSTLYFDKDVDRNNLMKEKEASRERCQKQDLWMIIADHLYKHAPRTKENSVICAGHNVTKIACFLGYCVDDEIKKCSEPIDCEYWISKMLADELDVENTCLKKETEMPTQAEEGSSEPRQEHGGLNSSWGDWNASLSEIERGNVWRDSMLIQNNYMLEHSMPILHHLADQGNFAYPTYEPPNVPPYPYPYIPYPYPYTHYPNPGNQSNQGGSYGLGGDDYFTSAMPDFGGSSSRYAVGGLSRGAGFNNDDDMDE
ncbi:hypothetical protein Tco_0464171 [Tanacetum coccineum]